MSERALIGEKARAFCDDLWQHGDFWDFESSEYERARCRTAPRHARGAPLRTRAGDRLRCGVFHPSPGALSLIRSSPSTSPQLPLRRARTLGADLQTVEFRVANAMDYEWRADGTWDLIVFSDAICYLGWLYSFFDVAWFAAELFAATRSGGRLLLANTMDEVGDKLLLPYIIRTYRDLFLNVGYRLETEDIFRGTKNGVDFEILISLFAKTPEAGAA